MATSAELLAAYDAQLRGDAETPSALTVERWGPVRLVTFSGGHGFISYAKLDGLDVEDIENLVSDAVAYFRDATTVTDVEWKTRSHDHAPGLNDALLRHGFVPDEPETIMIGDARGLAVDVPLPEGVTLRRITGLEDIRAMTRMQADVFGDPTPDDYVDGLLRRLSNGDVMEMWVAEAGGQIVSAGRLDAVPNSDFAGIWGGATRPEWRGRGIYRALTAARARSAIALGKTLIHSDSTDFSRPILERSGLIAVSTTTPYNWTRANESKQV